MMMTDENSNQDHNILRPAAASDKSDPWLIEPMPRGLAQTPLDFLFADHHRQRQAVQILLMIAEGGYDEAGIRNLIGFLEGDFALHILDEERDLVPLLRRQCPPEDGIEILIGRLAQEHADDKSSVRKVLEILRKRLKGDKLGGQDKVAIRAFAAHIHQHLAIENGVLLPIARVRMDKASLKALSEGIQSRRTKMK